MWWDRLDGTLPDPALFADLPGGADGSRGVTCTLEDGESTPRTAGLH
jgi:hypothetical protein